VPKILDLYENLEFQGVLNEIFDIVSNMNKYISEKKPWDLYKQQKMEDLQKILYNLVEGIRIVCILLKPIMHETSDKVLDSLGLKDQDLSMITWMDKKGFKDCIQVKVNSLILFTKLEIKVEKENILQYLDYKVGKIIDIEEHQKSGQYYLMTIDIESKKIPVIAKITKSYSISDLINKTVPVLVNLKPKKILGIESEGMLIGGVDKTTNDLKIAFIEGKPGEQILVGDFKPIKKELNEKQFAKYIIKSKNNTVLVNDQPLHTKNNKPKIDLPDDISLF
jgi:methionyl-tRNA synthetase